MNDQTQSLIRTALKIVGTYFVSHGIADDSAVEAVSAGLVAAYGVFLSYRNHKQPSPPAP